MLQPMFDRLLVKRHDSETKTASGLYIPDSSKEKKAEGVVIAAGPGKRVDGKIQPMMISVGDTVLFPKYAGIEHDEQHVFLNETDVLAIIKGA